MSRKPISITSAKNINGCDTVYALCDDGTLWALDQCYNDDFSVEWSWSRIDAPPIPDDFIERHTDRSWARGL